MNDELPAKRKPRRNSMRIPVPGEKQQLEDKQAHCPYAWRPTEKWQDLFSEQQFNLEEQKRAYKNSEGESQLPGHVTVCHHRKRTMSNGHGPARLPASFGRAIHK